ncbi:hypothetical protein W97_08557 [Coniosporium apollinis CBS 100218]|uniref:DNA2/NAM7 helicase-like C-terminal domain-containing protein n=1 Tax=Coniosporium apollinis (strain CBS 100218) TaxID=1168221 RepID=R7Z522_CONA1|nr:uncharacterized protein W97_08557 [Coniosporium apollinis CBS 100218]EON69198.1 hypothetical protein W97_08557 [Coniosporium apollinis CBS 100218]
MALDLSKTFGSDAVAKPYGDTTSKWNPAERDLIIMLTMLILAYKPKGENTQQLTAKDIVIITPYAGQRSAIIEGLQAASTQDPAVRAIGGLPTLPEVEVALPASMRGREAPIVLLSLVSNDHEDPSNIGLIYDLEQLKAEMGVAQKFLFMVGNFAPWCQDRLNNAPWLNRNPRNKHFSNLLYNLYKRQDIIALPDFKLGFLQEDSIKPTRLFFQTVRPSYDYEADPVQNRAPKQPPRKQKFDRRLTAGSEQPAAKKPNLGDDKAESGERRAELGEVQASSGEGQADSGEEQVDNGEGPRAGPSDSGEDQAKAGEGQAHAEEDQQTHVEVQSAPAEAQLHLGSEGRSGSHGKKGKKASVRMVEAMAELMRAVAEMVEKPVAEIMAEVTEKVTMEAAEVVAAEVKDEVAAVTEERAVGS